MPSITPLVKVTATQSYGAEVVLDGANYDEACKHALAMAAERKMTFLHPFDDFDVIAGQGTIGLEILEQSRTSKPRSSPSAAADSSPASPAR